MPNTKQTIDTISIVLKQDVDSLSKYLKIINDELFKFEKMGIGLPNIENNIRHMKSVLSYHYSDIETLIKGVKQDFESYTNPIKKPLKRDWYDYKLPKVLMDATDKRGFSTWGDLTKGSKNGFRHKILIWALPKVSATYKKRINTILNSHYK